MLDALKRLISRRPAGPDWRDISEWAQGAKLGFKRTRDNEGFVVDGSIDGKPWRLEWGPPQRAYIKGHELRLRMELDLPPDLQLLLLSQPLLETLERQTFERFTESTQTVIDGATPEEMRWLAMFPKVTYSAPKPVRMRFALVGSAPEAATAWVQGALVQQLEQASTGLLRDEPPFVVMVLRGRVYLRMQMPEPEAKAIGQVVALFETAVIQAVRATGGGGEEGAEWPSTASTAWQSDLDPGDSKGHSAK